MQDGGLAFCINSPHQYAENTVIFTSPHILRKGLLRLTIRFGESLRWL